MRNTEKFIAYRYRDTLAQLSLWEAARIMRDLGMKRFNYSLRDAVGDGVYAGADGDWQTFQDFISEMAAEWSADDQAAVDTEDMYY